MILDYVENYETITDEKTEQLIAESISTKKEAFRLIEQYYKKIKKTHGAKTAAQFYQIENYFISAVSAEVFSAIPLIGEME